MFDDKEKKFYCPKISTDYQSYNEANQVILAKFCSFDRRMKVRQYLQGLFPNAVVEKESYTVLETLEKIRKTNVKITPQGLTSYKSKEKKGECLYNAVQTANGLNLSLRNAMLRFFNGISLSSSPHWIQVGYKSSGELSLSQLLETVL